MGKPFELIFFISVMVWTGLIAISDGPRSRIEMVCKPVEWSGRVAGSVASIGSVSAEEKTKSFFADRTQECRMVIFKQFYEETYKDLVRTKAAEEDVARKKKGTEAQ